MTTITEDAKSLAALRDPFPEHQINLLPRATSKNDQDKGRCEPGSRYSADGQYCGGWHAKSIHLSYVGHAALTDRFLEVDPMWSWEPVSFGEDGLPAFDKLGGLWIRLTLCGVTRLGYGDAQGKTGPNAIKEAIGDALRNAGMRFGAALDLWHKGDLHDASVERGTERVVPSEPEPPFDESQHNELMSALQDVQTMAALDRLGKKIADASMPKDARDALRSEFSARRTALREAAK